VRRRAFLAAGAFACAAGNVRARAAEPPATSRERLTTRAEASAYAERSSLADVERFLAELDARGAPIARGSLGASGEGRDIPFVVASRPRVRTPAEALALRRPIVLVQAARDASAPDGTEALLAMLRDLCLATTPTLLEELVLVAVPLLNVDGSARSGPAATNAPATNGPALAGTRATASGIDLDTDFVRAAAPETRALLRFVEAWQPDAFLDLTTSAGGFHAFAITYAPALHPAAARAGAFVRETLAPAACDEVRARFGIAAFPDGRFGRTRALPEPPPPSDAAEYGWYPPDYRACACVNYMGVRGRLALLVAAYAHDPFERRIFTTRAYVEAVLGFCSDRAGEVRATARAARRDSPGTIPIAAELPDEPPRIEAVAFENLTLERGAGHEAGVPEGFRRTGTYGSATLPVFDRYRPSEYALRPNLYLVPASAANDVGALLNVHAIPYHVVREVEYDLVSPALTPAEAARASTGWQRERPYAALPGDLRVPAGGGAGTLAALLFEPRSADAAGVPVYRVEAFA
jgi:hypothetical protein